MTNCLNCGATLAAKIAASAKGFKARDQKTKNQRFVLAQRSKCLILQLLNHHLFLGPHCSHELTHRQPEPNLFGPRPSHAKWSDRRSEWPHLGLTMKVAFEGDNDGWPYDPNDGVVTLLLQSPDEGGGFEYAPNIRSKTNENYEGVKRLFDDSDKVGIRVPQNPGTLTFFNGRNSMHRVRPVGKTLKPRIVGIFSFDQRPDQIFGENYIRMIQALPQGAS